MSRARNIKPGFFKNDELGECSIYARMLFAGLWCEADPRGIVEDRPKRLKIEILPYDDCDVDALLTELVTHGFIQRYEAGGKRCIKVTNFSKHQNPHQNEKNNELPDAPTTTAPDNSGATPVQTRERPKSDPALTLTSSLIPDPLDAPNGAAPQNGKSHDGPPVKSKKPLPTNGIAQEIVAAFCQCAGIDEPAVYARAVGQAQQLANAGITVADVPSLFEAANWGDGSDLGKMLSSVDRWRAAKSKPPKDQAIKWPDWIRKRIDVHLQDCAANGRDPEPYPVALRRDMDAYLKSLRVAA